MKAAKILFVLWVISMLFAFCGVIFSIIGLYLIVGQ
jgi:hypothetical protein